MVSNPLKTFFAISEPQIPTVVAQVILTQIYYKAKSGNRCLINYDTECILQYNTKYGAAHKSPQ